MLTLGGNFVSCFLNFVSTCGIVFKLIALWLFVQIVETTFQNSTGNTTIQTPKNETNSTEEEVYFPLIVTISCFSLLTALFSVALISLKNLDPGYERWGQAERAEDKRFKRRGTSKGARKSQEEMRRRRRQIEIGKAIEEANLYEEATRVVKFKPAPYRKVYYNLIRKFPCRRGGECMPDNKDEANSDIQISISSHSGSMTLLPCVPTRPESDEDPVESVQSEIFIP